ncbi:hypothetical protein CK203_063240 [Vitis vinifera]|uniref:Uncharacterized protein n=1 Tax=Vitis vinifera TaxID=29760 RepID=A0A438FSY3_VITVI|nr:hypothetical protein CK203_063240 [Vitis vinifera]
MEEAKTMKTPMSSSIKLDKDEKTSPSPIPFVGWLLGERRAPLGLRASALLSHLSLSKRRLAEKRALRVWGLFSRMGWLPVMTIFELIFPTLVRAFYSQVTYGLGGPVMSTAKAWPIVPGFKPREAIQRLCGLANAQGIGKPLAHSLTMTSRVLHHMICSILLPRGGHRDEVSYLEAFIVDSILTGRRIHVRETNFEAPTSYDTYDEQSLGRMKFEKAPDGSWIRRVERQARDKDRCIPEQKRRPRSERWRMEPMMTESSYIVGPSSQPSFIELPHIELPSQAPHAPDHAPWMDVSAQISSLGTRIEELALVHDTRFYSIEEHIDQYQTGFTSCFKHFQQRFERIEERMDQQQATFEHLQQSIDRIESRQASQHEEMMAYLHSVFPPPPLNLEIS